MALTFDQFFQGIATQESGGNYGAINGSSGALGKYQILPSNVPYWSQKYLGTKWSASQFLGDPRKQDALARAVLMDYYDKYGVRGAAAAWYSGNPSLANDYKSQNGGPSIGDYVDQVIAHATGVRAAIAQNNTLPQTNVDHSVQQSVAPPPAPDTSGMGAVTAPGIEQAFAPGTTAPDMPGAQAVSDTPPVQPQNATQTPSQGKGATPEQLTEAGRQMALQAAQRWIGAPYVYGGGNAKGPTKSALAHGNPNDVGFDCSGFVQYALAAAGISAPRLSYDQLKMGQRVPMDVLQPGDLVGFGDGHHIAIYLGDGRIVEAPHTGANVRIRKLGKGEDVFGVSLSSYYHVN